MWPYGIKSDPMKNMCAPKFCAGAPKKWKLGTPVQPMQKVSL